MRKIVLALATFGAIGAACSSNANATGVGHTPCRNSCDTRQASRPGMCLLAGVLVTEPRRFG